MNMEQETITIEIKLSTPAKRMDAIERKAISEFDELNAIGETPTSSQWDQLEAFILRAPRRLTGLLTEYRKASDLMDELKIQCEKLRHGFRENYRVEQQKMLKSGAEVEGALLHSTPPYEVAVVEYNKQKNWVEYLDKLTDQYRYIKNTIDTKIELVKLRQSIGY